MPPRDDELYHDGQLYQIVLNEFKIRHGQVVLFIRNLQEKNAQVKTVEKERDHWKKVAMDAEARLTVMQRDLDAAESRWKVEDAATRRRQELLQRIAETAGMTWEGGFPFMDVPAAVASRVEAAKREGRVEGFVDGANWLSSEAQRLPPEEGRVVTVMGWSARDEANKRYPAPSEPSRVTIQGVVIGVQNGLYFVANGRGTPTLYGGVIPFLRDLGIQPTADEYAALLSLARTSGGADA